MLHLHPVLSFAQAFAYLLRNHDGAVLASGAAEGDGQVAFAFLDVVGQQIYEQLRDARDELLGLGKRPDVPCDLRISSGERAELGDEVGIGEKADVEEQIGVIGHSMFEAETDTRHQDVLVRFVLAKTGGDVRPQLMDIESGSIDDQVRNGADGTKVAALSDQRSLDRRIGAQRMRPARFAEAAQQDGLIGFEENYLCRQQAFDRLDDCREGLQLRAFTNVYHESGAVDLGGLPDQFGEARNQLHRQVVHAVETQILESLEDGGFAGSAHAGDDDQFARTTARRNGFAGSFLRCKSDFLIGFGTRHLLRC